MHAHVHAQIVFHARAPCMVSYVSGHPTPMPKHKHMPRAESMAYEVMGYIVIADIAIGLSYIVMACCRK